VLIAGRAGVAIVVSLAIVAVLIAIGRIAFGAHVPGATLPGIFVSSIVGAVAFCCLAFAVSTRIRNADAAQPILQATTLPLYFISGVFVPDANSPRWLRDIANVFPVRHLSQALLTGFDPGAHAPGIAWRHLLVVGAWGLGGLFVAIRRFAWTPS
jgi:ABC-2 type transport system permease protein